MRLTITIDLEKRDMPLYGARIKHALSGLLHQAHIHDIAGEYEYIYPASAYDNVPESRTVVTVTQSDAGSSRTLGESRMSDRIASDMGEMFNALKKERQEKRANNRENSAEYLAARGIPFVSKNGGAHLIVEGKECFIDFWPGTGKWNSRCGKKGFGVRNLVAFIGAPSNAAEFVGEA